MAQIIRRPRRVEEAHHSLCFDTGEEQRAGYGFDCDAEGNVDVGSLSPGTQESLARCLDGRINVTRRYIRSWQTRYWEPGLLRCGCGHEVEFFEFTNTCAVCGCDYGPDGHLLAPRSQWGEETGESISEILSAGHRLS